MPTNMKNVIADAFFRMVREKGIDKVTVKDLVETCHISRQTFYYHFQDIMDVLEWSARKGLQVALEQSLHEATPDKVIRGFVAAAMDNHDVIGSSSGPRSGSILKRSLWRTSRSISWS